MSTEPLEKAFSITRGIMANVKPDQLDDPTPCQSWSVRRLINHIVGGSHWFAASVNAGESPAVDENADFTTGDMLASYDEGIKASVEAFGAPGALEKMVKLPFGDLPGAMFMGIATSDQFTHGWDLARATGQPTDLDPEMAEMLLAQLKRTLPDAFRGPDGVAPFGPVVEVDDSAPAADRLAGFMGRTP